MLNPYAIIIMLFRVISLSGLSSLLSYYKKNNQISFKRLNQLNFPPYNLKNYQLGFKCYKPLGRDIKGYTFFELILVISLIAVVMGLSVPLVISSQLNQNNLVVTSKLKYIIHYAQEETIRRNVSLRLCAASFNTTNGVHTTLNNCAAGNNWDEGGLLFWDLNSDLAYTSKERISAMRFDSGVSVTLSSGQASNITLLYINNQGMITDANNDSEWTFSLSQTRYFQTKSTQLKLNKYGYWCLVGDSGC